MVRRICLVRSTISVAPRFATKLLKVCHSHRKRLEVRSKFVLYKMQLFFRKTQVFSTVSTVHIYIYNTYFHPENSGRLLFFATVILFRKLENHILSFYTSSLFFPGCEKTSHVLFFSNISFFTGPILLFHCGSLVFHRGPGILYPLRDACGPKNGSAHGWTKQ